MDPATGSTLDDHPAVARVRAALRVKKASGDVVVLDEHARTASAAAAQLGVTVAQIANSLVFAVPDESAHDGRRALLVLTSGAHRVDTAKVAALIGAPRLDRAEPDFVRERTGFAIGGVAPVGHATPMQTLVDVALADHEQIWAAAGHPRTVFPTTFDELVRITGGTPAEVGPPAGPPPGVGPIATPTAKVPAPSMTRPPDNDTHHNRPPGQPDVGGGT